MRKDTRIPLSDCKNRKPLLLNGIEYELDKTKAVGRGGSCLVYHAWQKDTDGLSRRVLLKEFYPLLEGCSGWRQNNGSLCLPAGVETRMERFRDSYERCKELFNEETLNQHIAQVQACPTGNGTIYMVVDYSSGITLNNYEKTCSLLDFFRVMKNLAGILGALHRARSENTKDYVHMDIKPDNILVLPINPAHPEVKELCKLLDTDSFIRKKELRPDSDLSGSRGYTAPEITALAQVLRDPLRGNSARKRFQKVGECSDMYSFGAVIYEYIFDGELPEAPYEICHSYEDRLEKCLQKRFRYIPYKAISLIRNLLKRTLAKDPYDRYETMSEIEAEIGKILKLIDDKKVQLRDNCHRNPDKILGREQKILELRQKLTDPALQDGPGRVVIVTGIGGIGKSSLAREYAAVYAEDYDIKAEVSAASARDAIQRIRIEHDPTDGLQNDIFEKKLNVIVNLCKEYRTLLIVNDYDTSDEPDDIWKDLGCDVILTSRHTWDNGEYPTLPLSCNDLSSEKIREIFTSYYLQDMQNAERCSLEQALQKEENDLWAILRYMNYHPLGIKLLARQMTFLPGEAILPAQMRKILEKEGVEEDSLAEFRDKKDSTVRNKNVYGHLAALYHAAFASNRLRNEDREALRYMILVVSVMGISKKRFTQWTGLNASHLQRLKLMGWLEYLPMQEDLLDGTKGRGVYVSALPKDPEEIRQYETTKGTYVMPSVIQEVLRREPDLACSVANCGKFVRSAIASEGDKGFTAVRIALYEQRKRLLQLLPEENSVEYARLLMTTAEPLVSDFLGCEVDDYLRILSIYKKSLEILKAWPDTYGFQQACLTRMIYCYGFLGDFEAAYILSEEMLEERRKRGLKIDRSYFQQMSTIYGMEFRSGKMKEAIRHMWQLESLLMEKERPDWFVVASTTAEIGQMLRKIGHWQQAENMLRVADRRFIRLFYSEDGPLAIEMHNRILVELGMLSLEAREDTWGASRLLNTALSLSEEFMQPTDLRVGDVHFYLAECAAKGNPHIRSYAFEEAAEHRKQALDIYQKQLHPGDFKIVLTKLLLALDYGEIPGMEMARDALLAECEAEIPCNIPGFVKGDPCGNFYKQIQVLAENSEVDKQIPWMFEFLEERRKLHLRLYGKDTEYLRNCEDLAELCEKYDLTEKAAHYRMIMDWDWALL